MTSAANTITLDSVLPIDHQLASDGFHFHAGIECTHDSGSGEGASCSWEDWTFDGSDTHAIGEIDIAGQCRSYT